MKVNHFQITSANTLNFDFTPIAPVCVLCGHYSDLALDLMREVIGDYGANEDPDCVDDGHFVLHADVEMDGKDYAVCYIRNADFMGDNRIAVNFKPNSMEFSFDDTDEYIHERTERNANDSNVLDASKFAQDIRLSESERRLVVFNGFIKQIPVGDDRPLFIYDFFDHIDVTVEIPPYMDRLVSLGRQVFIAVCSGYPTEKLMHDKVQIIRMESANVEN